MALKGQLLFSRVVNSEFEIAVEHKHVKTYLLERLDCF